MAETAVSFVLDKLGKLLSAEVAIFQGVHGEVSDIKRELELINSFLKDADNKAESSSTSNVVKEWVNQMREVAFRMEDVIDRYLLKVVERRQRQGISGAVTKGMGKLKTVTHRHDIADEIQEIRTTIESLRKTRELSLDDVEPSATTDEDCRRSYQGLGAYFVQESHLVGVKHNKKVIEDWLSTSESKRSVMVVAGPGGIGKTTIVRNVYTKPLTEQNNVNTKQKERQYFDNCAWITVSRPQDNDAILRALIQNISDDHSNPNASAARAIEASRAVSLTDDVRKCLKDKRYLIVFDDVRQPSFWNVFKYAMLDNGKGSKVIITTREGGVADCCTSDNDTTVIVHKLEPLSTNDALKLFRRKAFGQEGCPQELKALSEDFVKKCNGMPLAILAIAGLLSTKKKTTIEWKKVHNQLGSLLQSDPFLEVVEQVMLESYHDLPSHLKRCLLYFGLLPGDYSISCMRLVRLWVAEGLVKEIDSEDIPMEEYAKDYLTELFQRGLVHVSKVDFDGKPKSCLVHDLMHEFIVRKCEEQRFCQVMKDNITQPISKLDSVGRRLTINNVSAAMKSAAKWKRVRSCFVFDDAKKWSVTKPFFSSFELLTGLDLSDARLDVLPEEIGELLNLTNLSLRNTNVRFLPKSIGKLENLQTLDLKRTRVHELPEEIKNLIKLRHLLAYYIYSQHFGLKSLQGMALKKGLQNLTSLLKLSFLDANDSSSIIEELKQLRKLRKLGIRKLRAQYGEALCSAIESMTHLCSLSIGAIESNEILKLQSLTNPPESLQRLYLYGRLERFPDWIPRLKNLTRLYLKWSGIEEDPLPYLSNLSELLQLELYDTCASDELHFKNGWLKGLKVLYIESMPKLKTIKIDRGALPCLEKLKIGKCHEMVRVPWDVQNLTSLKALHLYDMLDQFIKRIMGPDGEDHKIVSKIPVVVYTYDDHFATLHNLDALNDEFGGN